MAKMRLKANQKIRQACTDKGVYLWEVADVLQISYDWFVRKMRHEMEPEEQQRILDAINKYVEERGEKNA